MKIIRLWKWTFSIVALLVITGCDYHGHGHVGYDDHHHYFDFGVCQDWAYSELVFHFGPPHTQGEAVEYNHVAHDWCGCIEDHGNWSYDFFGYYFDTDDTCYHEVVHPWWYHGGH